MLCHPRLRIAILNEEIALWEKRLRDNPDEIPYLGYIRTILKDRIKEPECKRPAGCRVLEDGTVEW